MKVSKRGGYSDRNGIKRENVEIQLKNFDKRTRNQFQNIISQVYQMAFGPDLYYKREDIQDFLKYIIGTVYSETVDVREFENDNFVFKTINYTIQNEDYDDVLTLIEAIAQYCDTHLKKDWDYYDQFNHKYNKKSIFEILNDVFKQEYVGYRFVDGIITPITDQSEINTITEALNNKYEIVYEHLSKANKLLGDRSLPDYENSIKESISAVEALGEIITGLKGKEATLGNILKKLEDRGVTIHGGLKSAFNILYGYTSDANGIRHAGDIGGPASTFEEAKFMLVACCAFVNYLVALSSN